MTNLPGSWANSWARVFFLVLLLSPMVRADYGWIPPYKRLTIKLNTEYLNSSENFQTDGTRSDIIFQTQRAELSQYRVVLEPEYGFSPNWSAYLKLHYVHAQLDSMTTSGNSLLSGNGISDIHFGSKWRFKEQDPFLTVDVFVVAPAYNKKLDPAQTTDLVLGDGSIDFGAFVHGGYDYEKYFFGISPGFLIRSGGYASAFRFDALAGAKWLPFYGYIYSQLQLSLAEELLFDTTVNTHNAFGAGGSYAFLSGSPNLLSLGIKAGLRFAETYFADLGLEHAVSGSRSSNYLKVVLRFQTLFSFYKPPKKRKTIREVPFDREETPPPPTEDQ